MNKRRMKELADYIEPREVDMRTLGCGSVACVAGHCVEMNLKEFMEETSCGSPLQFAAHWLGLTHSEGEKLFRPYKFGAPPIDKAEQHIRALKILRGEIPLKKNWLQS